MTYFASNYLTSFRMISKYVSIFQYLTLQIHREKHKPKAHNSTSIEAFPESFSLHFTTNILFLFFNSLFFLEIQLNKICANSFICLMAFFLLTVRFKKDGFGLTFSSNVTRTPNDQELMVGP